MNVVTLLGSSRSDGNTASILGWVEQAVREQGHDITRFELAKLRINGCTSCFACAESPDEPGCAVLDDARGIFDKKLVADAIVFATPLYMWSYAGQLKVFVDRCLCLGRGYGAANQRSFVEGTPAALLVACGGGVDNNADGIQTIFPRFADFLKLDSRGMGVFPNCTEPERLPNAHKSKARELAAAVVS